ncbi:MAG: carbohydrate kinase [Angelakisella sp.]|nr:carbohydrate kinase [Angelakisella sp.]
MTQKTLLAIGEALIDFIPEQVGCDFREVTSFRPAVGGAPANVCGAFARLGGNARLLTQLGDDPFGHKIESELSAFGIDTSCISFTDKANTSLAFVSLAKDGNRTFSFYRNPAADMLYSPRQIHKEWFDNAFALHFCSVSLGDYPMRSAHEAAIQYASGAGALISFDPNLRFPLWPDRQALHRAVHNFLPFAHIVKISDEELEFITGENNIESALPQLFAGNVQLVLYTCGGSGAYAFTRTSHAFSKPQQVSAMDTTGAGDGFIGSFLWQLCQDHITADALSGLSSQQLTQYLSFSNRFCGVSVQSYGAIASYPTSLI